MGIRVLGNNVLIAEVEKEETTAGGIILSADVQMDKASKPGLVIAVGDEVSVIEPGQRVFLKWSEAMPVNADGKAAVIVDREHIKAIIS
jgi:co-chaperonin GroES (HSP10)